MPENSSTTTPPSAASSDISVVDAYRVKVHADLPAPPTDSDLRDGSWATFPPQDYGLESAGDGWLAAAASRLCGFEQAVRLGLSQLPAEFRATCSELAARKQLSLIDWVLSGEAHDRCLALPVQESGEADTAWQAFFVLDGERAAVQIARLMHDYDSGDETRTALGLATSRDDASRIVAGDQAALLQDAVRRAAAEAGVDISDWGTVSERHKADLFGALPVDSWYYHPGMFDQFDAMMAGDAPAGCVDWDALPTSVPAGTVSRMFELCDGVVMEIQGDMWAFLRDTPVVAIPARPVGVDLS